MRGAPHRKEIIMLSDRRKFLLGSTAVLAMAATPFVLRPMASSHAAEGIFAVSMTEEEWQQKLTPEQYAVLRQEGTERPWTSPLLDEHREGTFHCAGCDLALFDAATKYESNTGWPSFYQPLAGAIGETEDTTLGMVRTEVHCTRCGGHQGHVFPDGPQPTGLRYCINGVALTFAPKAA
jgi:peptide-methionine (R)-S-oxide reductase